MLNKSSKVQHCPSKNRDVINDPSTNTSSLSPPASPITLQLSTQRQTQEMQISLLVATPEFNTNSPAYNKLSSPLLDYFTQISPLTLLQPLTMLQDIPTIQVKYSNQRLCLKTASKKLKNDLHNILRVEIKDIFRKN